MHPPFVKERSFPGWRTWWSDLATARVCLMLAGIMGLAFVVIWTRQNPDPWLLQFGLHRDGWNPQLLWRSFTYAFIHGNGTHLALNLAGLLIIGSKVERIGGGATVLKVLFAGVLMGGAAHLVLAPPEQRGFPLVGASGGIMALLLWLTTVSPDARTWPIKVSGRNLGRGVIAAEACLLAMSWLLRHADFQPVAHACHLGGAMAGWAIAGRLLRPSPSLDDLKKERARRESADGPESP